MTPDPLLSLVLMLTGGMGLVGVVLFVRASDQRARDARREMVTMRLPRGVKEEQVLAVVRVVVGLAGASTGVHGRDSLALEIVGTQRAITYRLRLPAPASTYLIGQLRASVPGLAVETVEDFTPELCRKAVELRRQATDGDLAVKDVAAVSRTVLAALTGLHRSESVVWQMVVGGGIGPRPAEQRLVMQRLWHGAAPVARRADGGVVGVALRLGAVADTDKRAGELVARLRRAAASVSGPKARLTPRWLPRWVVRERIMRAATPVTAAPVTLRPEELAALMALAVDSPLVAGLDLGGSPQLPAGVEVPHGGRVLGRATADDRSVGQPVAGAREHTLIIAPTGAGKTWLAVRMFLDDIAAGRGGVFYDPKGKATQAILDRYPEEAIGRTVVIDPTDQERPVTMPLLAAEAGGIPGLAADTLIGLLRHRHRDLGPRSTDILASSLYALARLPEPTLMDLLRLWRDAGFRAHVAGLVRDDPILSGFFAWFNALGAAERSFILAAPMNKVRPLLQRALVRNVLAAPRATFTMAQALRDKLVVILCFQEGVIGPEVTTLLGQVALARLWAAVQARPGRGFFPVIVDEAPRFLDQPTDLGDVLARSREYGVGLTLIGQSLAQFPEHLREVALNSARTKIAFGTSARDARRLAEEFGPGVQADYFTGLARYEAIGAVSLGGTVSQPFTFRTEALGPVIPGRAKAVRAASRARFGIRREEIEAALKTGTGGGDAAAGPVGRRAK